MAKKNLALLPLILIIYIPACSQKKTALASTTPINPTELPELSTTQENHNASVGEKVIFNVSAQGALPPSGTYTYRWWHNPRNRPGSYVAGAKGPSLEIPSVTSADSGNYTVIVSNDSGGKTKLTFGLAVIARRPNSSLPEAIVKTKGIFIPVNTRRHLEQEKMIKTLKLPHVDGAYVLAGAWKDIKETEEGEYNWDFLDKQLAIVARNNKKASISITLGTSTPEWVYAKGAKAFNTVVSIPRQMDFCAPAKLPIPWDPVYIAAASKFIRDFGKHIAESPYRENIVQVKFSAVSFRTDETALPFEEPRIGKNGEVIPVYSNNGTNPAVPCFYPDDIKNWMDAGYTGLKVVRAFSSLMSVYKEAFPNLPITVMLGDFPPIYGMGNLNPNGGIKVANEILDKGKEIAGDLFIVAVNSLKNRPVDFRIARFAESNSTGLQAAWFVLGNDFVPDPNCRMNWGTKPCPPMDIMTGTLNYAKTIDPIYLELFASDLQYEEFLPMLREMHAYIKQAPPNPR